MVVEEVVLVVVEKAVKVLLLVLVLRLLVLLQFEIHVDILRDIYDCKLRC